MSLLQDVTESEIPKDGNMPCGIFPEGIADKASPPDSCAPQAVFLYDCKVNTAFRPEFFSCCTSSAPLLKFSVHRLSFAGGVASSCNR